jgi:DNA-binding response OmpR family regulator
MIKYILVVDDDKEVREILSFALKHDGFEVSVASNGQRLQQLLTQRLPDLIILDVMMPGEDGFRLCRNLRHDPTTQHIPIIIMTAHAEHIYQRISADVGADQHITKPFHPLEVVEKVKALLETENVQN